MTEHYDIAIIGGGCSGLALAYQLAHMRSKQSVLVIENRETYCNDKTWCFWSSQPTMWTDLATCSWSSWSFHHAKSNTLSVHTSDWWRYYHLPSIHYYHFIQDYLINIPQVRLAMGVQFTSLTGDVNQSYTLHTTQGCYQAKQVIDTRPYQGESLLKQVFYGVEIKLPQPHSQQHVALMHDIRSDAEALRFNYILPLACDRVLFEHTLFALDRVDHDTMAQRTYAELYRLGMHYERIERTEYGCLPMGLVAPCTSHIRGGSGAGAIRPASGYGFLRIQAWAESLALRLLQPHALSVSEYYRDYAHAKGWQDRFDDLFLRTLRADLARSERYFHALGRYVAPDRLVRFLSDSATSTDYAAVVYSLPKRDFLRQCIPA